MTLPPIVPCARVACEPTIAHASASAVNRSRIAGCAAISACVTSAPSRRPSACLVDRRELVDAVDRDERRRAAAPCPGARRRRGRCRRRPAARRRRAPRAPRRPWSRCAKLATLVARHLAAAPPRRARASSAAARTRCADHLRDRVRDRAGGRDARRLADALRALRARRSACRSRSRRSSISGASEAVTSL